MLDTLESLHSISFRRFAFSNGPFPTNFSEFWSFEQCNANKCSITVAKMAGLEPRTSVVTSQRYGNGTNTHNAQ